MPVSVKICGIRTREAMEAALAGGADYVGLVFFGPSPRNVSIQEAAELASIARGRAAIVALVVDADDMLLKRITLQVSPDYFQLHGHETPEHVSEIAALTGRPIIKAVSVTTSDDATAAVAYRGAADLILFDAKAPEDLEGALPGGNGLSFDWRLLEGIGDKVDWMLSGGLTPDNVAAAIELTGARRVDVSSGVETAPGEKSPDLIARFLHAAKTAKH